MKRFIQYCAFLFVLLASIDAFGDNRGRHFSDTSKRDYKSSVIYQHPSRFFMDGFKISADWNIQNRYVINTFVQQSLAWSPTFYFVDQLDNQLGSEFQPVYLNDASIGIQIKNYVGKYSQPFIGYYFLLHLENGRRSEKYKTRLNSLFRFDDHVNQFKYTKFGIGFGRQWQVNNQGVLDLNIGFGYNDIRGSEDRFYKVGGGIDPIDDGLFGFIGLNVGIASRPAVSKEFVKQDTFIWGLTLDLNTLLMGGAELGLLVPSNTHGLSNYTIGYGQTGDASASVYGSEYWFYTFSARYMNFVANSVRFRGPYLSAGYQFYQFDFKDQPQSGVQFIHAIKASAGVISYIRNSFLVDAFVESLYTYRSGNNKEMVPIPMMNSGTHTRVGIKLGFANLRRYEFKK